jgi:hypothetical protein
MKNIRLRDLSVDQPVIPILCRFYTDFRCLEETRQEANRMCAAGLAGESRFRMKRQSSSQLNRSASLFLPGAKRLASRPTIL